VENNLLFKPTPLGKEYLEHKVFSELRDFIGYYDRLSYNCFHFITPGTSAIFNIDTHVFTSMFGTLDSIAMVLEHGRINDAFALLRKFYDSVTIDVYKSIYLKNNSTIEHYLVEDIDNWTQGKTKLPVFPKMAQYIINDKSLGDINAYFDFKGSFSKIRNICNKHSHYNSLIIMMTNDNNIINQNRIKYLDTISFCIRELVIFDFAYNIFLNEGYFTSTDYIDSLDCGVTPNEGSQYLVAYFTEEFFIKYLDKYKPDLANYLKANTSLVM